MLIQKLSETLKVVGHRTQKNRMNNGGLKFEPVGYSTSVMEKMVKMIITSNLSLAGTFTI